MTAALASIREPDITDLNPAGIIATLMVARRAMIEVTYQGGLSAVERQKRTDNAESAIARINETVANIIAAVKAQEAT